MRARSFFYITAGIFLLALSYHLGARGARAQGGGVVECVGINDGTGYAVVDHHLYQAAPSNLYDLGEIPSSARAIACGEGVVLEDGTVYRNNGFGWQLTGRLPISGPTPTGQPTWGQLKTRYR